MVTIHIDNRPYQVEAGSNLLQTILALGLDIPYFCWHPALGAVGACRQCAVKQFKDEQDTRGRIVMACLTAAEEGLRISIDDSEGREARAGVIEFLMENHPHDCPVCDEGGECHLQDMTVMTGHTQRRFRFPKRTFRNQDLGPFINHEMNRCITCYRCVRFYRDYAGGRDFNAMASRNRVYFGRSQDGILENEFSGNLVEVCPTGVFTDKTFKAHYARKWDLQTAPSVCVHCGLGCNTLPAERVGTLRRIQNRYNGEVNGYFLCDRGRFGYGFVNSTKRLIQALQKKDGEQVPVSRAEALATLVQACSGNGEMIGIGSPRASLEANFALRTLVGQEHFYSGLSDAESELLGLVLEIFTRWPVRSPSLRDIEQSDAVLVLGEDVTQTAPRVALSLRQAVRCAAMKIADDRSVPRWSDAAVRDAAHGAISPLFIAASCATRLDDVAQEIVHAAPDDLARLGFAVAHALNPEAPAVTGLSAEMAETAARIAQSLRAARHPLVVSGTGCASGHVIRAAANVARALAQPGQPAGLCLVVPECNSLGLAMMRAPGIGAALRALEQGLSAIVLENDLYRRASRAEVDRAMKAAKRLIAVDALVNETTAQADLVLPAATFAESSGTLVSGEGRAQRFFSVMPGKGDVQESWRWMADAMKAGGRGGGWNRRDEVTEACAAAIPALQSISLAAPAADFRIMGEKIPRQPNRYSGRTALNAQSDIHEQKPPDDPDSALAFSMEGYYGRMPSALLPYYWAPGWNSVQALNKFQDEIAGPMHGGDPGIRLLEAKDGGEQLATAPSPLKGRQSLYFTDMPDAFQRRAGEWLIFPLHHIFGSDELSMLAPPVAERCPVPHLALTPEDAAALGFLDGELTELHIQDERHRLIIEFRNDVPRGMAGLPRLQALIGIELPAWGEIYRVAPA